MKAVMYGAGNIGRGFVGALLSQAGYRVTFVDVAEPVVEALKAQEKYPVRYVTNDGHEDVWVENVTAVDGKNPDLVADVIAGCDIMATAVGARILKFIVPNIVAGLRKRWASGAAPLNIIICENLMDANRVLEGMIKEQLTAEEQAVFDATVGLVEASIGRMVPVQTEEMKDGEPLRVCVERYGFLPVDRDAFKGAIPEIPNLCPVAPFDFYIKRKLYLHNMGHAICAYLGGYRGMEYIWQAIDDADILCIVQNAMLESAMALSKQYNMPLPNLILHVNDLLGRFRNRALGDTCAHVGGDPVRKLGAEDRLIGASRMIAEQGTSPVWVAIGAAGALYRYLKEAEQEQNAENARKALKEICGISLELPWAATILEMYDRFCQGVSPKELRSAAQDSREKNLGGIL